MWGLGALDVDDKAPHPSGGNCGFHSPRNGKRPPVNQTGERLERNPEPALKLVQDASRGLQANQSLSLRLPLSSGLHLLFGVADERPIAEIHYRPAFAPDFLRSGLAHASHGGERARELVIFQGLEAIDAKIFQLPLAG